MQDENSKATAVIIQSDRPAVLEAVKDFAVTIERALERDETIVNALATLPETPPRAHIEQLRANAELRARFMREVPWLRAADVARLYGMDAVSLWKGEERIFSVMSGGVEQFPLFQFAEDQPVAAMHDILAGFASLSGWQIALWFFAPNAWLDDVSPMDVLHRDPQAVIAAARHAVEPIEG